MNDNLCLIDTDILSYILKKKQNVYDYAYNYFQKHKNFTISCITYYECLRGYKAVNALKRLDVFHELMNVTSILYLDQIILEKAGDIYSCFKQTGKIPGEFDIIIGATAISKNLTLVTNNQKHYRPMEEYFGLKLDNWDRE